MCLRLPTNRSFTSYLRKLEFSLCGVSEKAETKKEQRRKTLVKQMKAITCLVLEFIDFLYLTSNNHKII